MTYAVIMAGGVGSRFWPASTKKFPKQFLSLFSDQSLLQETVQRIEPQIPPERVYVITNQDYVELVKKQVPGIPADQVIGEPVAKNTAPCVAAAASIIHQKDEDATMVVLPADHYISEPEAYNRYLATAIEKAQANRALVTIGIEPDRPETGYGYIQFNESEHQELAGNSVYAVKAFTEKPDADTARDFLKSGNYLWNSGMFIWNTSAVLDEIEKQLPDMYEQAHAINTEEGQESIDKFYHACNSISIDYGIMEHAENVFVVPGSFGWNDVGSWKAVYELSEKDKNGNVKMHEWAHFEQSDNSLVFSHSNKMIALTGLENVGVIETDTSILVVNLEKAQTVKHVVNALKENSDSKKFT